MYEVYVNTLGMQLSHALLSAVYRCEEGRKAERTNQSKAAYKSQIVRSEHALGRAHLPSAAILQVNIRCNSILWSEEEKRIERGVYWYASLRARFARKTYFLIVPGFHSYIAVNVAGWM